jgi:hypothetical protein
VAFEIAMTWLTLHPTVGPDYRAYYIDMSTTCLNKPVIGTYALGDQLSFLPPGHTAALKVRVCGWDGPAGDGTHSVGTTSRLHFAVPAGTGDLILTLDLTAVGGLNHPAQQRVKVAGNDVPLGEFTIPADGLLTTHLNVPAAVIDQGKGGLNIVLSYPDAVQMFPGDSNTHWRSIKLRWLRLRHAGEPEPQPKTPENESDIREGTAA